MNAFKTLARVKEGFLNLSVDPFVCFHINLRQKD